MSKYKKTIIVFAIAVLMVSLFAVSKTLAKDIIFDPGTDNVGIGTSTPLFKLDVDGTGRFTSPLVVATPTASDHATTRSYVDSAITSGDAATLDGIDSTGFVAVGGDTMTGTLTFNSNESGVPIASTFGSATTKKNRISFTQASGSNDPGYIVHETSGAAGYENKGVLHLVPTDDNTSSGDYVAIHGTNDPETIRIFTDGTIDGASGNISMWTNNSGYFNTSNDGSGSGLDADLLDGLSSASFDQSNTNEIQTLGTSGNTITLTSGGSVTAPYATNATYLKPATVYGISASTPQSSLGSVLRHDFTKSGPNTYRTLLTIAGYSRGASQIAFPYGVYNDHLYWRRSNYSTDTWEAWMKIWDDGNDGSGSGLDADYVDGLQASSFLRSDANDTFTASSLTLDSGAYLKTRLIGSLGTELGIGAGEMWSTMNGNITGETLWLGGESGVKIVSSPDNMGSGWTGRHEATLVNTDGNSTFPGDVTAAAFYYNSDKRLKDNIVSLGDESLDVIDKLNPVSFTWKEDGSASQGFIAQEVEQVLPELVKTNSETNMKSVQYANLTAVLTAGIKAQQEKINDLETELEILKIQVNSLKNN
jgi:hypothetical protein